jgi:hypothetical protein
MDITPDDWHYFLSLTEMYRFRENKAHLRAGYVGQYYDLSPEERSDYQSHTTMVGFQYPIWEDRWFFDIAGLFTWRDYEFDPHFSFDRDRFDLQQDLNVQIIGRLDDHLLLTLLFQHIWNDSNISNVGDFDPFNFKRAIFTCMVTFVY